MKINPGDFQEVDSADMFHKSENQSERLVHWQMTNLKFKSQMIFGQKCLVCSTLTINHRALEPSQIFGKMTEHFKTGF